MCWFSKSSIPRYRSEEDIGHIVSRDVMNITHFFLFLMLENDIGH